MKKTIVLILIAVTFLMNCNVSYAELIYIDTNLKVFGNTFIDTDSMVVKKQDDEIISIQVRTFTVIEQRIARAMNARILQEEKKYYAYSTEHEYDLIKMEAAVISERYYNFKWETLHIDDRRTTKWPIFRKKRHDDEYEKMLDEIDKTKTIYEILMDYLEQQKEQ